MTSVVGESGSSTTTSVRQQRRFASTVALAVARHRGAAQALEVFGDPQLAVPEVQEHVVAAAAYHGIVPLFWNALRSASAPAGLATAIQSEYRTIVARGLRLDVAAHAVADVFDAAGIGYALFKGEALATGYYPDPALRFGSDVDILVAPDDIGRADELLIAAGITTIGSGWRARAASGISESSYMVGEHGHIDLHWHVLADLPVQAGFDLDIQAMISRAPEISIAGRNLRILDPADMFITVSAHACFSGGYKLGWMVDIATLADHKRMDWGEVAARTHRSGLALPVQVMLDRAAQTLASGTALRQRPDQPLAGGLWRRGVAALGHLWPVHHGSDQILRGAFIYRATRSTTSASLARLGRTLPWDAPLRYLRRRRQIESL
jgi:hypothetical protein